MQLSEVINDQANQELHLLLTIVFPISALFVNGIVNRHKCRYRSNLNSKIFQELHTQHPEN